MRIQQEILQKFLKAGKAAENSDPIIEDSLANIPIVNKTDETADFGEADEATDQEQIERDYEFRASQIKEKLMASGAVRP